MSSKCPKCDFENPEGSKFCNQCGAKIALQKDKRLELLQTTLPDEMKDKILAARIGGERKNVTVLFADVSGFTELSEKLDPEEITDIINKLFNVLIKIVYEYEGTIDKLIGDCIMALFGAPITHENDPERAVHAALDILYAMDRFNEEQKTSLSIHIGINSGLVVVGGVGSDLKMDYTVMGDTVNYAERLMELAKDEILVSESVYKQVSYLFEALPLEKVKVKGKAQQLIPYRIIGRTQEPTSKRGVPGLESPLIARDSELKALKSALDILPKGKAFAISIIADTGVGKSRLVQELRAYASEEITWLGGKAFAYGKHLPFRALQEQIRAYLAISEFDAEERARESLAKTARHLFKGKFQEYFPYLCQFISLKVPEQLKDKIMYLDPEPLKVQTAVSVKALLREVAAEKPLVLYFEDTHLIDQETVELITFLLDGLKDSRILFLFEARPEEETAIFHIRKFLNDEYGERYMELRLEPLKPGDAKTLIKNLLNIEVPPADLLSLILRKSEGNPFYIEEIIATLIDEGIIQAKGDSLKIVSRVADVQIPDSVEAVVRARIDKLPPEIKSFLGTASVIGRSFSYKLLSCVDRNAPIPSYLATLENRQLIVKLSAKTSEPQDAEYAFRHILTRDICYKGLLKKTRREIHSAVADCMEHIYGDKIEDQYEILAFHHSNAHNLQKALSYYEKSGDTDRKYHRNDAAIDCYSQALTIHETLYPNQQPEKRAALLTKRGDIKELQAAYDSALEDFKAALSLCPAGARRAELSGKIGNIFYSKSDYETAISHYEQAVKMLDASHESLLLTRILIDYAQLLSVGKSDHKAAEHTVIKALTNIDEKREPGIYAHGLKTLGSIAYKTGDYDKSLEYRQKALALWKKLNEKREIADGYTNVGAAYFRKGELDKALQFYKEALSITEEMGYKWGIAQACRNIGLTYRVQGERSRALQYFERCLAISEEIGNKSGIAAVYYNMGHIYLSGELDEALKYYKKSLAISEEIGNKAPIGQVSNNIGIVYRSKGELDTALKYYTKYLEIAEEIGDKWGIGAATGNIGFVYYDKGDLEKAMEYAQKSVEIFEKIGYMGGVAGASQTIGQIFLEKGAIDDALKQFERYFDLFTKMGIKREIGRANLSLGNLYAEIGQYDKARKYLDDSLRIAEENRGKIDMAEVYLTFAEMHTATGDYKAAIDFSEKAFFLAKDTGAKTFEILALRAIGMSLAHDQPDKALSYLEESVELAKKHHMRLVSAKALLELARVLTKQKKPREAEKALAEASGIFKETGALRWIDKVASIRNQS
jgi:class 3 adenylate cyclase/tetratricopeptide (TPR) repeat protein